MARSGRSGGSMCAPVARVLVTLLAMFCAPVAVRAITNRPTPYRHPFPVGSIDTRKMDYPYGQILGLSFLFFEAQRSGMISETPDGGSRVPWRGDQLLDDGDEEDLDLSGGHYEAGNRLKISLASAFTMGRLAKSCLYYHDIYANIEYDGESLLYWCKREVKFGAYWLLKTYVPAVSGQRTGQWSNGDKFVIMVGTVQEDWGGPLPGDFDCYKRAENIPAEPNCPKSARKTLLADAEKPAADAAAEVAAALALSAALLQLDYPLFADYAIQTSHALYDFADKYPTTAVEREFLVNTTYPTSNPDVNRLWASTALAWVHTGGCDVDGWALCNATLGRKYRETAEEIWTLPSVANNLRFPLANWDNSVYESSLLLDLMTNTTDNVYRETNMKFVMTYVEADGSNFIEASPKGMRVHAGMNWANLRIATFSSAIAGFYSTLPGVDPEFVTQCRCLARSQMGYVVGDTGRSFVVGYGTDYPLQLHHRDSACTLAEDAQGKCDRKSKSDETYMFKVDRPNPHVLLGAIVGGPDASDVFTDKREEFHFTEVALDYNAGLTLGLASVTSFPSSFWSVDCSRYLPNYPWEEARAQQPGGATG